LWWVVQGSWNRSQMLNGHRGVSWPFLPDPSWWDNALTDELLIFIYRCCWLVKQTWLILNKSSYRHDQSPMLDLPAISKCWKIQSLYDTCLSSCFSLIWNICSHEIFSHPSGGFKVRIRGLVDIMLIRPRYMVLVNWSHLCRKTCTHEDKEKIFWRRKETTVLVDKWNVKAERRLWFD
jgi:hypothetical protein